MLLPSMKGAVLQEACRKNYELVFLGPGGLEGVFALLTEIIAYHMRVTIIEIRVPSLERPV